MYCIFYRLNISENVTPKIIKKNRHLRYFVVCMLSSGDINQICKLQCLITFFLFYIKSALYQMTLHRYISLLLFIFLYSFQFRILELMNHQIVIHTIFSMLDRINNNNYISVIKHYLRY